MSRRILLCILTLMVSVLCALPVLANAAEPPCFTILVNGAPEDLQITLITEPGEEVVLHPLKRGWESYFRCGYFAEDRRLELEDIRASSLRLTSASAGLDKTTAVPDALTSRYNTIFLLDLPEGTLAVPELFWRNAALVAMRVGITLLAEALILWLFGYREKRTWIVFLAVNLLTQTLLNLALTGNIPPQGYWWIGYYLGEILIFAAEALAFGKLFTEKSTRRAVLAAVCANLFSLGIGGMLLMLLPL